jgi:hypothetical protein
MRTVDLSSTPDAWTFARFDEACRDLGVSPVHVLHVGGHLGQEVGHYRAAGVKRITYMEPTPANAAHLRQLGDDVTVIEAAAGPLAGFGELSLCGGDGAWNTIRPVIGSGDGVHRAVNGGLPVRVVPVRDVQGDADVLVVDTQGTEVEALGSAALAGTGVRLVIVETQSTGHPEAAHLRDVNDHMAARGWAPALAWSHERYGRPHYSFADVFYVPMVPTP